MGTKDTKATSTALANPATGEVVGPGEVNPTDIASLLNSHGFSHIKTIKLGDPESGAVGVYCGVIVAKGVPIQAESPDGKISDMPTWVMKPADVEGLKAGKLIAVEGVTHIVICSYVANAAFERINQQATATKTQAFIVATFTGKMSTRKGRVLNDFDISEKYVPLPGTARDDANPNR